MQVSSLPLFPDDLAWAGHAPVGYAGNRNGHFIRLNHQSYYQNRSERNVFGNRLLTHLPAEINVQQPEIFRQSGSERLECNQRF